MHISPKKQNFVNYIQGFISKNGRPPTFVEIMNGLKIKSLGTIHWYVTELEKEGIIKRTRGHQGKRALSILEKNLKITLPLLGIVQAGYPLEAIENKEFIEVPAKYLGDKNFVLKVRGNSMIDEQIREDDFIIVKESNMANNGDLVVAYVNEEATLKRFYKKKNSIELHPANPKFNTIKVKLEDSFRIGGKVLGLIRNY
ncbi:MAG: repressor LexA [Candidatus Marinimicrobia bacterium]|nr:repressor LexA [Candidatus Neomarinimicrobiota bacterium]|tara:strand:+ start:161 stop:757 length:597 start_codon:yes stop_codon:yes gene_type:complete